MAKAKTKKAVKKVAKKLSKPSKKSKTIIQSITERFSSSLKRLAGK